MRESKTDQSVTTSRGFTAREPSTRSVPATAASTSTQTQNDEEREKQRAQALARELSEQPKTGAEKEAESGKPEQESDDRSEEAIAASLRVFEQFGFPRY